ncbi:hypothetical protein O3M35_011432 [Rhynocoris fuscipes]|uniref:Uncharacterized protein n=1 Tax=Rhynocoris fuscipes TaxID=488301 RepID=A0AAW1CY32_9HEMI
MTFEARDSAAKVVPTPRTRQLSSYPGRNKSARLPTRWESKVGSPVPSEHISRRALTAAFVQFSRELGAKGPQGLLGKSPSAPDLAEPALVAASPQRSSQCALLSPHTLLQRQALSVDNPEYSPYFSPLSTGSQASMALDLHLECPVTLKVRDKTRRSDTARRHVFVRQKPVETDDLESQTWSPKYRSREDDIHTSLSTPHSRRESIVKMPSKGINEERPRIATGESIKRRKSKDRSDRGQASPSPIEELPKTPDDCEIVVIEPSE